jgi:hypothetical protein
MKALVSVVLLEDGVRNEQSVLTRCAKVAGHVFENHIVFSCFQCLTAVYYE